MSSLPPIEVHTQCFLMHRTVYLEQHLQTLGGRITCNRCQARSKRSGHQCRAPAIVGKNVCRFHGGKSIGPRTQAGVERCAQARTVHGNETSSIRMERSLASAQLAMLESVGFEFGMMPGPKSRGPKPHRMAQVLPELHALARHIRSQKNRLREQNTVQSARGPYQRNLGGVWCGLVCLGIEPPCRGRSALKS